MIISIWLLLALISLAGAVGGLVNGLLNSNGFLLPCTQEVNGLRVLRPGFLGNMLIGIVAAMLSWGLYGPLSTTPLFRAQSTSDVFTLSSLVGAILIGIAGARWINTELDKKLLTLATSQPPTVPADGIAAHKTPALSDEEVLAPAQKVV